MTRDGKWGTNSVQFSLVGDNVEKRLVKHHADEMRYNTKHVKGASALPIRCEIPQLLDDSTQFHVHTLQHVTKKKKIKRTKKLTKQKFHIEVTTTRNKLNR